ncbi:replication protein A 70 kDa DNA-binding subunit-like [Oscarella lobularis]|uniref:replication protein A 70 kDa DNA-binding subunit-like n=1 Tax=Oscarella lobularis TaxID=121494 RepID=UPI003313CF02
MSDSLSRGAIQAVVQGRTPQNPILQILNMKKIQSPQGSAAPADRYRLIVSDGESTLNAMMATQLNPLIMNNEIERYAILCLTKYVSNEVNGRKIIIILGVDVIRKGSDVNRALGSPVISGAPAPAAAPVEPQSSRSVETPPKKPATSSFTGSTTSVFSEKKTSGMGKGFHNKPTMMTSAAASSRSPKSDQPPRIFPIKSLNPYQSRWTIRARVANKTPMKTWSNSRGDGQLFSIDLVDESDEIRGTAFNDQARKFFDVIEKGKMYYISRCQLRPANKKYTSIKNDYELYFSQDTTVELCSDFVGNVPEILYDFVAIKKIEDVPKDSMIDVLGILTSVGESVQITARSSGRQVTKRDLVLTDKTGAVTTTLWGEDAVSFDGESGSAVAIKGARVSDFGGRCLSVNSAGSMNLNSDVPDATSLKEWYKLEGHAALAKSISGGLQELRPAEFKLLSQIKGDGLGHMTDKPDYFSARAMVVFFKKDNCLYKACPLPDQNFKVVEAGEGVYRCEKLDKTFDSFKWRFILQLHIADFSGEQWISCFNESGEALLGMSSEDLGNLKETNETAFDEAFSDATFKLYNFRLRIKMETYNDEQRLKCTCLGLSKLNFREEASTLMDRIKQLEVA